LPTMLVSELAREHVTMTLSGDGGDELFQGYGMYRWAERLNNPFIKAFRQPLHFGLSQMGSRYQRIGQMFDWQNGDYLPAHIFSQEQYFFTSKEARHLNKWGFEPPEFSNIKFNYRRNLSPASQQALFDLNYYLPDDLLVKVDRASMRYSLETRVPLLDYRLVEFALNLDDPLKIKGKTSKYLLKELLYQYVPRELFNRPKWGFSVPLNRWLKTDLLYLKGKYLGFENVKNAGLVNPVEVELLLYRFYDKNQDYLYNRVWALICLHQWYYNRFVKR
jgi:asparagine synthase (glutamine-hydrolysing)